MRIRLLVLLAAVVLTVPCCGKKAAVRFDDPKALGQAFMDAVFAAPGAAYAVCEDAYRESTSEDQFGASISMVLPPADSIEAVRFIAFEDGMHEADGAISCSCTYEVLSSDEFQPRCEVGVEMVKSDAGYQVRRFTVSTPPE